MGYEFSFGWAFAGLLIMAVGALFLRFHQVVADNFGSGMADYEHYKLYGLLAVVAGFLTTLNIIPLILYFITSSLFGGGGDTPPTVIEE